MRLRFCGEENNLGLKKGKVYEIILSSKFGDRRMYVTFKPDDKVGDWVKIPYSSLSSFFEDWIDVK